MFLVVFEKSSSCREKEIFKKRTKTQKLDLFLTYKKAKIGPVFNSTAYVHIHIYIYIYFFFFGGGGGGCIYLNLDGWMD